MVGSEITFTLHSRKLCLQTYERLSGFQSPFFRLNSLIFFSEKANISHRRAFGLSLLWRTDPAISPPFCRQQKFGIFFGSRDAGVFLREIFPQLCIGRLWNEWDWVRFLAKSRSYYYFCASSKVEENKILIFPWKRQMLFIQDRLLQQVFTCELFKTTSYTSVQL